jgi:hypothetical protein
MPERSGVTTALGNLENHGGDLTLENQIATAPYALGECNVRAKTLS